jgi:hypothetical protein
MKRIRVTRTVVLGAALALVSAIAFLDAQDATEIKLGAFMPISGISKTRVWPTPSLAVVSGSL